MVAGFNQYTEIMAHFWALIWELLGIISYIGRIFLIRFCGECASVQTQKNSRIAYGNDCQYQLDPGVSRYQQDS